jgi:hypothetical protein
MESFQISSVIWIEASSTEAAFANRFFHRKKKPARESETIDPESGDHGSLGAPD